MTASTRSRSRIQEPETPNKKRKVEPEEQALDAPEAAPDIGERCEELWFDDGNVIVAAKEKAFKIHRGVLMRRSEVFKELLSDNAIAHLHEKLDGFPVLRLEDEGVDLHDLLNAIYDGGNR